MEVAFPVVVLGIMLVIGLVFVAIVVVIVRAAAQRSSEARHNAAQGVETLPARVVSRRTETSGSDSFTSTRYFATFELADGSRQELTLPGSEYGLLADGDHGMLSRQGTSYQGFQRRPASPDT